MNKKELVELKKRILALSLVGTMALSFAGCSKTDNKNTDENIYSVSYNSENKEDALYKYVLNPKSFISEKYTYPEGDFLYKIESEENYGTNIFNEKTLAFYRQNMQIVWPDCYNTYSLAWFSDSYFDFDMKKEVISSDFFGEDFVVIYSNMTAKKTLHNISNGMYNNGQKQIEKGDKFSSIAIYHDNELVGFKQTGVGSDSNNVIASTKGDVDTALKSISAMDLVDNKNITYEELKDIQEQINDKPKIKVNK